MTFVTLFLVLIQYMIRFYTAKQEIRRTKKACVPTGLLLLVLLLVIDYEGTSTTIYDSFELISSMICSISVRLVIVYSG